MKIGILVHSETGHTLSVAQALEKALAQKGHEASIRRVWAAGETAESHGQVKLPVELLSPPDAAQFDAVIFGAPVWGFSLSKVMSAYMRHLPGLAGRKAGCFVTQHLASPHLGGNHAVRQMKRACKASRAEVYASGIVNWSGAGREEQIASLAEAFSRI